MCVLQGLEENMGYLIGDCLLAASFLSYMGPFLSNYRDKLLAIWMKEVRHRHTQTHTHLIKTYILLCSSVESFPYTCTPSTIEMLTDLWLYFQRNPCFTQLFFSLSLIPSCSRFVLSSGSGLRDPMHTRIQFCSFSIQAYSSEGLEHSGPTL